MLPIADRLAGWSLKSILVVGLNDQSHLRPLGIIREDFNCLDNLSYPGANVDSHCDRPSLARLQTAGTSHHGSASSGGFDPLDDKFPGSGVGEFESVLQEFPLWHVSEIVGLALERDHRVGVCEGGEREQHDDHYFFHRSF